MARNYGKTYNFQTGNSLRRRKIRIPKKLTVFLITTFFLLAILSYLFIFSEIFKITKISISGNIYIAPEDIEEKIENIAERKKYFVIGNNIIFFNNNKAENELLKDFPRIENIDIKKKYFNNIIVKIMERETAETLCLFNGKAGEVSGDFSNCYFIDKNGIAFDRAQNNSQGFLMLRIVDKRGISIELNQKTLNPEFLEFAGKIKDNFKNYSGNAIRFLALEHPAQKELVVHTDGWKAIFDVSQDAGTQLFVLKEVLQKEIKDQRNNLDYIDLRVDGRAYYKLAD